MKKKPQFKSTIGKILWRIYKYCYVKRKEIFYKIGQFKPKDHMGWTIYGTNETRNNFSKRMCRIHKWFKYLLVYPGVMIGKKILGKALVKEVPDVPQFKNARIFDQAVEMTLVQWNALYRQGLTPEKDYKPQLDIFKRKHNDESTKFLRTMKELYLTGVMTDTAYLTPHDFLMHNITKLMIENYKDDPEYILYKTGNIRDYRYYVMTGEIPEIKLDLTETFKRIVNQTVKKQEVKIPEEIKKEAGLDDEQT